jgi:hypothetical protein
MIEIEEARKELEQFNLQIKGKTPIQGDQFIKGEPVFVVWKFPSTWKEMFIVPISDCHYGNHLFSEHHFIKTIRTINSKPNIFTILNGDLCECVTKNSLGNIYQQTCNPQEQRDWMIERLKPIKNKILGMTMGNHEERIWRDTGIDICKDIADALDIPYRLEGLTMRIMFGDNFYGHAGRPYIYDIYATHGWGGARTKASKAVKIERTGHQVHADVYLMSHDHEVNVATDNYLMPSSLAKDIGRRWQEGKFTAHCKMLVKTNAYLKWGGYSEKKGYPPAGLETPIIRFIGQGKAKVKVEL